MMQHIATSKTDIAALVPQSGNPVDPVSFSVGAGDTSSSEQFRHLLKEQQPHYKQPVQPKQPVTERSPGDTHRAEGASTAKPDKQQDDGQSDVVADATQQTDSQSQPDSTAKQESAADSVSEEQYAAQEDQAEITDKEDVTSQDEGVQTDANTGETEEDAVGADEIDVITEESSLVTDMLDILTKVASDDVSEEAVTGKNLQPELAALLADVQDDEGVEEDVDMELELMQAFQSLLAQLKDPESDMQRAQDVIKQLQALLADVENRDALMELAQGSGVDLTLLEQLPLLDENSVALLQALMHDAPAEDEVTQSTALNDALAEVTESAGENTENDAEPSVLERVVALPEESQEKILNRLAEDIVRQADTTVIEPDAAQQAEAVVAQAPLTPEQMQRQQAVLAALQNGVKEIQSQLEKGNKPAIDLQALVDNALSKVASEGVAVELNQQQLTQALQQFSQQFELTHQIRQSLDTPTSVQTAAERPLSGQQQIAQAEAGKTLAQQNAQNDRAVNITRPEGHQQLTEKVRFMVSNQQLQADIRLDPPELGSMKVRVNLSGESASVNFVVQSQQAREVLEHNAPRLKALLEEQGIELGQSFVQQESNNQTGSGEGQFGGGGLAEDDVPEDVNVSEQRVVNGRLGGIDYFV